MTAYLLPAGRIPFAAVVGAVGGFDAAVVAGIASVLWEMLAESPSPLPSPRELPLDDRRPPGPPPPVPDPTPPPPFGAGGAAAGAWMN